MEHLDEITITRLFICISPNLKMLINKFVCILNISGVEKQGREQNGKTHIVPGLRVLMRVFSSSSSLAKPKSDILAFRSSSSSTLVALISL